MTRTYEKQMIRHIVSLIIFIPLTLFGAVMAILSIFALFTDFLAGISMFIVCSFISITLGAYIIKTIINMFRESKREINYHQAYIIQFGELECKIGTYYQTVKIATDSNGKNYYLNGEALEYLSQNGLGWYQIGIQENAELIDRYPTNNPNRNPIYLVEVYSIYKINA